MAISAKENDEDVEMVKNKLRHILDVNAELNKEKQIEENAKLMSNIYENIREKGPSLV